MNKNKGFTLIELLVVIAIIVILASIVLVGIQSATKKAKDARIIANISQVRTQAEILYSSEATGYTNLATQEAVTKLLADIKVQNNIDTVIRADKDHYCVYAQLLEPETPTSYQCIDSSGNAVKITDVNGCTGADATHYTCVVAP